MQTKHIQYKSALCTGLFFLTTLSSCVHTRHELGMGGGSSKDDGSTQGNFKCNPKNIIKGAAAAAFVATTSGLGGYYVGQSAGYSKGHADGRSAGCTNGSYNNSHNANLGAFNTSRPSGKR